MVYAPRRLLALTNPTDIVGAACRELIAVTRTARVFASYQPPNHRWEDGVHVAANGAGCTDVTPHARSALFAIHRRVVGERGLVGIRRSDETEAIFRGLVAGDDVTAVHAVPLLLHGRRVAGELVVLESDVLERHAAALGELADLTTVALENAHRLAFARRDQERLLLLAEATEEALYDWSFDTREFWWGGGILAMVGSAHEPVEHTPTWKLDRIHADDVDRVRASLDAAIAGRSPGWQEAYRFRRADGSFLHVEDHAHFQRDRDGRAYRMLGAIRDVSALKDLLAREQRARAEAELASRAKNEFLAMLGHELRNPLAPIVTGLQLLRLRGASDNDRALQVLERQAQHMIRLVDDLLDISRIEHGKIVLEREDVELASVIAAAIETASPLIESRRHTLRVDVPSRGLEVHVDRARMSQVVANVLNNAAKYTDPGGHIAIEARRDGAWIAITVRDNGVGIAPEALPAICNMFVQEAQSLDRSHGGLGLGLSIVRSLLELHGGTVEARSAGRGRGSEFVLRIPAVVAARDAEAPVAAPATAAPSKGRRVVVIDDNEDAADLLAMSLEELGHEVWVGYTPSEAFLLVDAQAPDVVILDIGLPGMDGYEVARQLRAGQAGRALQLVALTGYGQAADREHALSAGFDAHLVKPITAAAIASTIDRR